MRVQDEAIHDDQEIPLAVTEHLIRDEDPRIVHVPDFGCRAGPAFVDDQWLSRNPSPVENRCAGGGSGIRTHGGLPHTRFPSVPIRPLSHPSRNGGSYEPPRYTGCVFVCGGGSLARVGSGATGVREPSQVREEAALSGPLGCRRVARSAAGGPPPHTNGPSAASPRAAPVRSRPWPACTASTARSGSRELVGQDHVTTALRNAVTEDRVGHAYLFSGPRGTGQDHDRAPPRPGAQLPRPRRRRRAVRHVRELRRDRRGHVLRPRRARRRVEQRRRGDARPHPERAPRRRRVEPAQGVHHRRGPHALGGGVEHAAEDARGAARARRVRARDHRPAEGAADDPVAHAALRVHAAVGTSSSSATSPTSSAAKASRPTPRRSTSIVRRAAGSARDALSLLDQALAVGGGALDARRGAGRARRRAVRPAAGGARSGRDRRRRRRARRRARAARARATTSRRVADDLLRTLRDAFLAANAAGRVPYDGPAEEAAKLAALAQAMGNALLVRGIEILGQAIVDIREQTVADPRLVLEVAVVRVARREARTSVETLLDRVERLERQLASAARLGGARRGSGGGAASPRPAPRRQRRAEPAPAAPASRARTGARAPRRAEGTRRPRPPRPGRRRRAADRRAAATPSRSTPTTSSRRGRRCSKG